MVVGNYVYFLRMYACVCVDRKPDLCASDIVYCTNALEDETEQGKESEHVGPSCSSHLSLMEPSDVAIGVGFAVVGTPLPHYIVRGKSFVPPRRS